MVLDLDWGKMFAHHVPYPEIFIRGTIIYLGIFLILRFVLKREAGTIGIADLLMIVLIADASQNAMASNYTSVSDGLALIATIVFWNYAIDWLGYHFPWFERLVMPPPLPLIKNGKMLAKNMRQELITKDELLKELRLQGVQKIEDVQEAYMESDGRISIVQTLPGKRPAQNDKRAF